MSGFSEARGCPRCGSPESLEHSQDNDHIAGMCSECGYGYSTTYFLATLAEVNDERGEGGLRWLTELKSPIEGWVEEKDYTALAKQEAKQETVQSLIDYLENEIATQDERTAGAPLLKAHLNAIETVILKVLINVLEETLKSMPKEQEDPNDSSNR